MIVTKHEILKRNNTDQRIAFKFLYYIYLQGRLHDWHQANTLMPLAPDGARDVTDTQSVWHTCLPGRYVWMKTECWDWPGFRPVIRLIIFTAFPFVSSFFLSFTEYDLMSPPVLTALRTIATCWQKILSSGNPWALTIPPTYFDNPIKTGICFRDCVCS